MNDDRTFILRGLALAAAVAMGVVLTAAASPDRGPEGRDDSAHGGDGHKPRDHDRRAARRLEEAGTIQGLETILAAVRERRPGRVLEVELEYEHRDPLYEVTVLDPSGVVWELEVDAASGAFIEEEREH